MLVEVKVLQASWHRLRLLIQGVEIYAERAKTATTGETKKEGARHVLASRRHSVIRLTEGVICTALSSCFALSSAGQKP